ncbi:SDR family oxidoreductase [Candidatus Nitrospira allomarina]|uniref:SDR family oxidoreductase n=1 Tax=Candidatus Nitrospira allomarina TaxID=3020900 RepID=A0AA96GAW0_9BACT|nr:SDR family oxidoreductase [Candidatus Nitrospira allomarina]WNM57637.1 SDR family oxidoreductase [Candidatus Nitrospira allomarina]
MKILLTGATGYVGGRLLARLEQHGRNVRCLARRPEFLKDGVGPGTEVIAGDVLDPASLATAMSEVEVAYYLVHSMGASGGFEEADRIAARNFGKAAWSAGLNRLIYLGGLGDDSESLSPHLRSRHEVGEILRQSGVPVVELRASIVIGSGSLSFEMIRTLVERLPVMLTPRWVHVPAQPIAINDVLAYLIASLDVPLLESLIVEIGGDDIVSYGDLMREYAHQRGLRRIMIPVPVLTPRLSSLWLGLVTPLYARVGRKLIQSIKYPTVVRDHSARRLYAIEPISVREAIAHALRNEDRELAESRWSDALSASGNVRQYGGGRFGNRLHDVRTVQVPVSTPDAFRPIQRIGGRTGWYFADWLWALRGWLDLLVGGVGLRRGRRDPEALRVGDVVDWWRVEAIEPGRRLRLFAEMKLPGRAWLEYLVEPGDAGSRITQTASFDPIGLGGLVYWYGIWPVHELVFRGMIRGIARAARRSK